MRKLLAAVSIAALMAAGATPAWPQETTSGPTAHPVPIIEGQSATPSGGIASGGAATEAPAPLPPAEPAAPLPPGPPAPPQQAELLSSGPFIVGAAAATAIIICALTCFSHATSTTTSTTVQHH